MKEENARGWRARVNRRGRGEGRGRNVKRKINPQRGLI